MIKYFYIIFLNLISISLSSCGIEVAQPIPRLYSPNGLIVENAKSGTGVPASTFKLTWCGLNPELEFSGYNIYYATNMADASAYRGIKILCPNFNKLQATLPVRTPFNVSQKFTFSIHKFYYANSTELFTQGKTYWFFITSYNAVRNIESPPSQYFQITFEDNIS